MFQAIENAFRLVTVLGGSTNAVLHLLAIARTAQIAFTIDDIKNISEDTPLLANMKPSGNYVMEDIFKYRFKHSYRNRQGFDRLFHALRVSSLLDSL